VAAKAAAPKTCVHVSGDTPNANAGAIPTVQRKFV